MADVRIPPQGPPEPREQPEQPRRPTIFSSGSIVLTRLLAAMKTSRIIPATIPEPEKPFTTLSPMQIKQATAAVRQEGEPLVAIASLLGEIEHTEEWKDEFLQLLQDQPEEVQQRVKDALRQAGTSLQELDSKLLVQFLVTGEVS